MRTILAALLAISLATVALAQTLPDYDAWVDLAETAEAEIEEGTAPTSAFTTLRERLAEWRAELLEAETVNSDRVATITGQIDALGPAPDTEAGESEPADIAARRDTLNDQLEEARAPQVRALEAYNRADGLIAEIDELIRTRQTEALLETVPSPANPANWPDALSAAAGVASTMRDEVQAAWSSDVRRAEILRGLPLTLLLLAAAGLMLFRGRQWSTVITDLVQRRERHQHGRILAGFLVSITQVAVPLAGILLFVAAVASLDLQGDVAQALLQSLVRIVLIVYGALWIVARVFPKNPAFPTLFELGMGMRAGLRRTGILIGAFMGIWAFLDGLAQLEIVEPTEMAVLYLPVILGLSYGYFLLFRQFSRVVEAKTEDDDAGGFGLWLLKLLGRALGVAALVGPIAALLGYSALALAVAIPTGFTLGLIGFFVALQWPIRDLYAWIMRSDVEEAADALIPVLVNLALLALAVPVVALIWGVRQERLSEIYARFNEGVTLGDSRLTPGVILTVLLVFGAGYLATRLVQRALKTTVLPRTSLDAGARNAVTSFVGYFGIALAVLMAVSSGGIDLTALGYIFGALSVGIGFGLQNVVQNFVAGIILLIERPIGEGDWIEVGGQMGIVKSISVRSTTIETFDKQDVIVPNADFISGTVTNWTRGSDIGRVTIEVGVAYGTDTRRVEAILKEIAGEHPVVAAYPEPGVDFLGFGASSLDFRIRMILRDVNQSLGVKTEVRHRIAERFAEEGIEMPFPQRDLWIKNPENLAVATPSAPPKSGPGPSRPDGSGADREDGDTL